MNRRNFFKAAGAVALGGLVGKPTAGDPGPAYGWDFGTLPTSMRGTIHMDVSELLEMRAALHSWGNGVEWAEFDESLIFGQSSRLDNLGVTSPSMTSEDVAGVVNNEITRFLEGLW